MHTESEDPDQAPYTLGQFFTHWGVPLDDECVGEYCGDGTAIEVYLNGEKHEGDPTLIELAPDLEVAIVIGEPPDFIPDNYPFFPDQ